MARRRQAPFARSIVSRHEEGEDLYGRIGDDANDAVVVVLSAGAIEVGYPMAYLLGRAMVRLDPHALTADAVLLGVDGVRVVLVDDGLLHPAILVTAARAIRRGNPSRLVLAAPILGGSISLLAGPRVIDRTVQGPDLGVLDPYDRLPFEGEDPLPETHATALLDQVNQREGGGWATALLDVRLIAPTKETGLAAMSG